MGITRSEKTVRRHPVRNFLHREQEQCSRLVKATCKEVSDTDREGRGLAAGIKAQRSLEVLNGEIGLPAPQPKPTTPKPPTGEAWIEFQSAIYEDDGGIDIPPEITKRIGSVAEDIRVVTTSPKRATGIFDALLATLFRVFAPSTHVKFRVAASD